MIPLTTMAPLIMAPLIIQRAAIRIMEEELTEAEGIIEALDWLAGRHLSSGDVLTFASVLPSDIRARADALTGYFSFASTKLD